MIPELLIIRDTCSSQKCQLKSRQTDGREDVKRSEASTY
jgi:hypothetical protein